MPHFSLSFKEHENRYWERHVGVYWTEGKNGIYNTTWKKGQGRALIMISVFKK